MIDGGIEAQALAPLEVPRIHRDQPVDRRLAGSLAAALASISRGARIVRVHDVAETHDALKLWQAIDRIGTG